ncbi:MAG: ferritin-like domain-containing protein [Ktedonobacteraceae bacterium]
MALHIQNPQELFFHDLCCMYEVEQQLARLLTEFADESSSREVKNTFKEHQRETTQHMRNLDQCFEILRRPPLKIEHQTIAGMKLDHDALTHQQISPQMLTLANITAGIKSEYLEMAAYHCLIDAADVLGLQPCIPLFEQNLRQEESFAQKLVKLGHQLGSQQTQHV